MITAKFFFTLLHVHRDIEAEYLLLLLLAHALMSGTSQTVVYMIIVFPFSNRTYEARLIFRIGAKYYVCGEDMAAAASEGFSCLLR